MAAMPNRQAAKFTLIWTVTAVRFHIGMTPFLDHAGAAHKGCVKRTIEGLIPGLHGSIGLRSAFAIASCRSRRTPNRPLG